MKKQIFIYLSIVLCFVGCNTHKVLVSSQQVKTRYVEGNRKEIWEDNESSKRIPLQSLHILIIDGTDVKELTPYQTSFKERLRTDEPLGVESVIESVCYNKQVIKKFKKGLPKKAIIRVLDKKVPEEVLDSLIRADNLNLIITARRIKFNYEYEFVGWDSIARSKKVAMPAATRETTGNSPMSNRTAVTKVYSTTGKRNPPTETRTITYYTEWELRRVSPDQSKKEALQQIRQQGCVTTHIYEAEELLSATAKEAGKIFSQIFRR